MTLSWYRYEDVTYSAGADEWGDPIRGHGETRVHLRELQVLRETPKGVWLASGPFGRRFVLRNAVKRYACPTVEEAAKSFLARKRRQAQIHRARAEKAERAIRAFATTGVSA